MKTRTLGGLVIYTDDKERDHGLPPCDSAMSLGSLAPARRKMLTKVAAQLDVAFPTGLPAISLCLDDCIHCSWPIREHTQIN
jgi:hypothetical protein